MVTAKERKELERRGIYTFVSTEDRDIAVEHLKKAGFFVEPLGEAMLIASKDPERVKRYKEMERVIKTTLEKMVKEKKLEKRGKLYKLVG